MCAPSFNSGGLRTDIIPISWSSTKEPNQDNLLKTSLLMCSCCFSNISGLQRFWKDGRIYMPSPSRTPKFLSLASESKPYLIISFFGNSRIAHDAKWGDCNTRTNETVAAYVERVWNIPQAFVRERYRKNRSDWWFIDEISKDGYIFSNGLIGGNFRFRLELWSYYKVTGHLQTYFRWPDSDPTLTHRIQMLQKFASSFASFLNFLQWPDWRKIEQKHKMVLNSKNTTRFPTRNSSLLPFP